jgi:hypothetical protein
MLSHFGNCDPETAKNEYCIFHKPGKTEGEAKEFWRKFFDKFKPEEAEIEGEKIRRLVFKKDVNCSGYVFPMFFGETEMDIAPFLYFIFSRDAIFSEAKFEGDAFFPGAKFGEKADFSGTTFSGNANFPDATFSGDVSFSKAKFGGKANFSGAKFGGKASFLRAEFEGDASFSKAEFEKNADFSEAKFEKNVIFSKAKLKENANFFKSTFSGDARFLYATFSGDASFPDATFSGNAVFSGAKFGGDANFSKAKFEKNVGLRGAKFEGNAVFSKAEFKGKTGFYKAEFKGNASFSKAEFGGNVRFSRTTFSGDASFSRTTFLGNVHFLNATFLGNATFYEAKFGGGVSFFSAAFLRKAGFSKAKFGGSVTFSGAKFEEDANFSEIKLEKSASLSNAEFNNSVNFSRVKFPSLKDGNPEDLLSYASFRGIYFRHPKKVVFDGIEGKAKISFIGTDISRVVFRNCSFDFLFDEYLLKNREKLEEELENVKERINRIKKNEGGEDADEELKALENHRIKLIHELENLTLDNVLSVIRMLRDNFDHCMKYEESGKLFVKEMDLKRDYLLKGGEKRKLTDKISGYVEWLAYSLYRIMGLYGESIARPIFWVLVTIIMFGIFRGLFSPPLMKGIWESLEAFMQLRWDGSSLTLVERAISVLNLGVLYTSAQRKLKRRIRH